MLKDIFNREINYLRISVTDRCDLRCKYCMKEKMEFLPKKDVLTFEQIERLVDIFISEGVNKIRLTGGEPLVRKNIEKLIDNIGKKIGTYDFKELTLTTNGTLLKQHAKNLKDSGINRINISLDTLNPLKYEKLTRLGNLRNVLEGIDCAIKNNIKIKINVVALKNFNENEFEEILIWCGKLGIDVTFIEVMPMGETDQYRYDQYLPLNEIRNNLIKKFSLENSNYKTGGPSKYNYFNKYDINVGFITPLSQNFCQDCNRVRITCTGRLYMCLGQEKYIDFKKYLNNDYSNQKILNLIYESLKNKPKSHDFIINKEVKPYLSRFMNTTGG